MLGELSYRNLDDEPALRRHQHHHRGAGPGGRRPARRRGSHAGALGEAPGAGRRSRSPCTSRTSPGRATSGRCERPCTSSCRTASTTRHGRAAATSTTAGLRRPGRARAGRSHEHAGARRLAGARTRRRATRLAALLAGDARTAPWCWSTAWSPRRSRTCWCPRRAGCGSSCSCTCRSAARRRRGADAGERAVLAAAAAVVTTSGWTRAGCSSRYALAAGRVHVAEPGRRPGRRRRRARRRRRQLLCVAAVTPGKGHDVLLAALAAVADLPWRCVCVGSLDRDPALRRASCAGYAGEPGSPTGCAFAGPLHRRRPRRGLRRRRRAGAALPRRDLRHGRDRGAGPRAPGDRDRRRRACPRRSGAPPTAAVPGLLVPPGRPGALAAPCAAGSTDPDLRRSLRARRAGAGAATLTGWYGHRRPGRAGARRRWRR